MTFQESRLANKLLKATHRVLYRLGLRKYRRAHKYVLEKYLLETLSRTSEPTVIETGCIRDARAGTESTLTIASTLKGHGKFFTFELNPKNIKCCKEICRDYNSDINYVEGDSIENLTKLVQNNTFKEIHFAFFDSVNDGDHIFTEFRTVEHLFRPGSIVVVDDVLFADKGRCIRPHLEAAPNWIVKVFNVENGMLVARITS